MYIGFYDYCFDFGSINIVPMPRPVDEYFKTWEGPKRPEFRKDIDMTIFSGNQKWQIFCLEKFLEMNER